MSIDSESIVAKIVAELEAAWNAGDGAAFARTFADDADFVNIRGEHHRSREAIAKGHEAILATIYKGSTVRFQLEGARPIAGGVVLAHVKSLLKAPSGPLAGEHNALFSLVLIEDQGVWRIVAFHNTLVT